jgi:hypothetical protein
MIHHSKQAKKAIVTFAIGKPYYERWHKLCEANWRRYAEHHGYDLICIDSPLDKSLRAQSRSAAWQKCLILSDERIKKYDRVVWVDSDILINPNAPCIVSKVPEDKVGATNAFEQFAESLLGNSNFLMDKAVKSLRWSFRNSKEYYLKANLPEVFEKVVQTGVIVLSPRYHRSILEYTYYNHNDTPVGDYEMEGLSYELLKANCVHWLDSQFNTLWSAQMVKNYPFLLPPEKTEIKPIRVWKRLTRGHYQLPPKRVTVACLKAALSNSHFLHFAGATQYMPWLNTANVGKHSL